MYNIADKAKNAKIKINAFKYGIKCREVLPVQFGMPVGELAEGASGTDAPGTDAPFTGEMLVMCGFTQLQFNSFTEAIRSAGAGVALKAVLTETNALWTSAQLYNELCAEREAFKKKMPPRHKKK